jgi:pantoate--beta-alanine ligase
VELIRAISDMQAHAEAARCAGRRLVLVPTMGALHGGHLALVEGARRLGDHLTVSIFVNPTQFGPNEDFAAYPRTEEADLAALTAAGGVDAVFAPSAVEMYPGGLPTLTTVHVAKLGDHLCGPHRPGHFDGVASVVATLFLACRPHVAVFGQKDAQQLAVVRRMSAELGFGVEVVGAPTVREADGLAMSSRNRYLSPEERTEAVALSRALDAAETAVAAGERSAQAVVDAMRAEIAVAAGARLQYAEVVETETLQPVSFLAPGRYLAALAVLFGNTRLIDNTVLEVMRDEDE